MIQLTSVALSSPTLPISTKGPFRYLPGRTLTFCDTFLYNGCVHFFPLHQLQLGWHISKE